MNRHGFSAMMLMALLFLTTSCSLFIGPAPGQQDSAAQMRNDSLRADMGSLQRAMDDQKAQLAALADAKLWVRIPFDSGHATVHKEMHKVLHDVVARYRALRAMQAKQRALLPAKYRKQLRHPILFVQGFCDNEPIGGYDGSHVPPAHHYKSLLALSEARAVKIAEILMQSGITHEEVRIQAFGASNFIGSNASDSERQKNRRVDVFLAER